MHVKQLEGNISKHSAVIISGLWHYRWFLLLILFYIFHIFHNEYMLLLQSKEVLFNSLIDKFAPLPIQLGGNLGKVPPALTVPTQFSGLGDLGKRHGVEVGGWGCGHCIGLACWIVCATRTGKFCLFISVTQI